MCPAGKSRRTVIRRCTWLEPKEKARRQLWRQAFCSAAGYKVGAYFSPYVYDPRERVQVNEQLIPHADFARLVTQIRPHIEALEKTELGQTTEFELKTALGFCYFAEQNVDIACIEVGLGGRLDATNVVKPAVCVITNIGLDHMQQLGDTHALIAGEKAGIIKAGVPCLTAADHPDALEVIQRVAHERNAPLALVRRGDVATPTADNNSVHWNLTSCLPDAEEARLAAGTEGGSDQNGLQSEQTAPLTVATASRVYERMPMHLGGLYQRQNAACAVAAVEIALQQAKGRSLSEEAVRHGLATVSLPGRLETVQIADGPLVVLDGAHNAMAAEALVGPVRELVARHAIARVFLVIGMLTGHAPEGLLASLAPLADQIVVCQPRWKRAQPAEELAAIARELSDAVIIIHSVPEAVRAAIAAASPHDMVLVTGSFYTVGEAPVAQWGKTSR